MNELIKITEVDVPEVMVNRVVDEQVAGYEQNFRSQGIALEQYLSMLNTDLDGFKDSLKDDAEKVVRTRLAMDAIVEKENIEVTDEEIEEEANTVADKYFGEDEEQKKQMVSFIVSSQKDQIKQDLIYRKAVDFLLGLVKEVEKKEEADEDQDKDQADVEE